MDNEWLSRNEPPRKRRSYENNWASYEARGSGRGSGGGLARFSQPTTSRMRGGIDRNNITAQGERVGMPHNPYPRQAAAAVGGGGSGASNYYGGGSNSSSRGGGATNGTAGSRIRVADYRGAAARVGALPEKDGPPPSIYQTDSSFNGGGRVGGSGRNNDGVSDGVHLFQNAEFLKSLANPPPVNVKLPGELRSTLNGEQCTVVESVLSGHSTFFTGLYQKLFCYSSLTRTKVNPLISVCTCLYVQVQQEVEKATSFPRYSKPMSRAWEAKMANHEKL